MPIYEYKCENGHVFEEIQKMADDALSVCTQCGAPVERVFHPVAVHFKGSGFYTTDYGSAKAASSSSEDSGDSGSSTDSGSDSKSEKKSEKKSDSKSDKAKTSSD